MFISVDARRQWFADVETQPDPGENLVLTIDKNIQYIAEKELDQAIHDTQAIAGTVIVENPHTGEILALANRPTFNPNLRKQITPAALTNRAVSYVYEPGSTFKLVTISAALEEKAYESGRSVRLPDGIDRLQRHAHSRLEAARVVAGVGRAGGIERRGLDQNRAAPGRRSLLQIHSRLRIRAADRHRVARRNARA